MTASRDVALMPGLSILTILVIDGLGAIVYSCGCNGQTPTVRIYMGFLVF